jgi:hypothetical protein
MESVHKHNISLAHDVENPGVFDKLGVESILLNVDVLQEVNRVYANKNTTGKTNTFVAGIFPPFFWSPIKREISEKIDSKGLFYAISVIAEISPTNGLSRYMTPYFISLDRSSIGLTNLRYTKAMKSKPSKAIKTLKIRNSIYN